MSITTIIGRHLMTTESFLCFLECGGGKEGPDDEKDFAPVYDPENAPAFPGDIGVKKRVATWR